MGIFGRQQHAGNVCSNPARCTSATDSGPDCKARGFAVRAQRRFLSASLSFGAWGPAAECEIGALTALVALQASDPFPVLRLCDSAPAERLRIIRELIQQAQVADRTGSNNFHVHKSSPLLSQSPVVYWFWPCVVWILPPLSNCGNYIFRYLAVARYSPPRPGETSNSTSARDEPRVRHTAWRKCVRCQVFSKRSEFREWAKSTGIVGDWFAFRHLFELRSNSPSMSKNMPSSTQILPIGRRSTIRKKEQHRKSLCMQYFIAGVNENSPA